MTMNGFFYSTDQDYDADAGKKKTFDIRSQTAFQISNKCQTKNRPSFSWTESLDI